MIGQISNLFQLSKAAPPSKNASGTLPSSRTLDIPATTFSLRLEKYLDDYRKGRGDTFSSVPGELNARSAKALKLFASTNPSALRALGAYSTALTYDQKARFLSNLAEYAKNIEAIGSAKARGLSFEA